ncbi:AI-2E family transporter [Microbacterium gorillae]|uniref:AI-2E family transporter n=1 Tax=Microbacterium gorillae TaxID=1231063 RepID=UPI000A923AD0|nr:AI-2E family transporter [Microbacterium gorillae]
MKVRNTGARATTPTPTGGGMRIQPFTLGLLGGLGVLVALLIGGMVQQLVTVLVYVGIALFLALGLDPVVSRLEKLVPRPAAIAIVVAIVLILFGGIIWAIVPVVITQVTNLTETLPKFIDDVTQSDWYKNLLAGYGSTIQDALKGVTDFLGKADWGKIGGGVLQVGSGIAGGVTGVIIVLILTLYFMASLRSMKHVAARFVPAYRRAGFADLLEDVSSAVGRYVIGQISLAAINGVCTLILMLIVGAPVPALMAMIAFIGSCIPLVGTLSASIINTGIVLVAALVSNGPMWPVIVVGVWYLVYMQVEAYVISPRIMNKAVSVPGAVVVIAAVAGAALGSVLGALVAVPVAASVIIIIQKVVFPAQDAKTSPPPGTAISVTEE